MPDFEAIVERSSNLVTVFETDGTVQYQNGAIERYCGYESGELVGDRLREYVHPTDRGRLDPLLQHPTDASVGDPIDVDYRLRHTDGSWTWFQTTTPPWSDDEMGGYVLVSEPVDERRALKRRLERYTVILDSLDDAVYAIDSEGTIVYVNEAYADLKGVDREDLLGTDIYRWGTSEAAERITDAREDLAASDRDVGIVEFDFSTADGERVPVEMRFSTVTRSDDELERVGVLRDVTERKARERALNRKNERLEAFASIVSHDLRNPLNVAMGHLGLVRENTNADEIHADDAHTGDGEVVTVTDDHLTEVEAAHDRMETLIENLLKLAREGANVADPEPIALANAVERSWRGVATEDATLTVETDRVVLADRSRLRQILENCIRNSIEHAGPDVTVTVGDMPNGDGDSNTDSNTGTDSDGSGFYVADDGPGIPESIRDRVLEPGFSTTSGGTGFGLGIVAEIVDAHGWTVAVTESANGGARIEITGVEFAG